MTLEIRCEHTSHKNTSPFEVLLGVVNVEEVRVESCLDQTGDNGNGVHSIFHKVAVDPVGQVECSVEAESEDVVCCDDLSLSCPLEHEQLRQNSNGFEVDREGPKHL